MVMVEEPSKSERRVRHSWSIQASKRVEGAGSRDICSLLGCVASGFDSSFPGNLKPEEGRRGMGREDSRDQTQIWHCLCPHTPTFTGVLEPLWKITTVTKTVTSCLKILQHHRTRWWAEREVLLYSRSRSTGDRNMDGRPSQPTQDGSSEQRDNAKLTLQEINRLLKAFSNRGQSAAVSAQQDTAKMTPARGQPES